MIDTEELTRNTDLYQLIERDTEPGRVRNRLFCPFCQTESRNSPALSVTGTLWHCHGCASGGTAIDYVMQRDNVDFREACRRLGWNGAEPDPAEQARRAIEAEARRQAETSKRAAELDALLREYTTEEIWQAYSRRMTDEHRLWWMDRGIPQDWQEHLKLGYVPDKTYRAHDGNLLHSPAYTIPYFHTGFEFRTMQYRLHNPERPQDRYRFEHGLKSTYYQVEPAAEVGDFAIVCEGAIKAMATHIYGGTGDAVSILAVPAKESHAGLSDAVKHCKKVWVCLDPDCWERPQNAPPGWTPAPVKLAGAIGKQARIVRLPGKIDDMILEGSLSAEAWKRELKLAWRTQ